VEQSLAVIVFEQEPLACLMRPIGTVGLQSGHMGARRGVAARAVPRPMRARRASSRMPSFERPEVSDKHEICAKLHWDVQGSSGGMIDV